MSAPVGGGEGAGALTRDQEAILALTKENAALRAEVEEQTKTANGWMGLYATVKDYDEIKDERDALAVEVEQLRDEWTFAAEAGTKLRALIEEAPHTSDCHSRYRHIKGACPKGYTNDDIDTPICDCWKSKALEGRAR